MKKVIFTLVIAAMLLAPIVIAASSKQTEPLDKITFIHYKDGTVKIEGKPAKASSAACYKLLGVKWASFPISYVISPNVDANAIVAATTEWDSHTSANLFGVYTISSANFDDFPDGSNEYSYGNYPQSGVIAVTRIWATRYSKQIVEFDVMFDSDFVWGDAKINPTFMDWRNIATHETGHGLGLGDVYNNPCSQVTMFGYSSEGDIGKRTLEPADIAGLQKLYGQ